MASSTTNGTIAVGTTPQTGLAADPTRRSLMIQAGDSDLRISFDLDESGDPIAAAADVGWLLEAGKERVMYVRDWPSIVNAVSVWCADSLATYVIQADGRP